MIINMLTPLIYDFNQLYVLRRIKVIICRGRKQKGKVKAGNGGCAANYQVPAIRIIRL